MCACVYMVSMCVHMCVYLYCVVCVVVYGVFRESVNMEEDGSSSI